MRYNPAPMKLSDFYYDLPDELIARYPAQKRTDSRLFCLDKNNGAIKHSRFADILNFINPNDLLVFNDSRVIPARLYGHKLSGGKIEILVERILDAHRVLAHMRSNRTPQPGSKLIFGEDETIEVNLLGRQNDLFELEFVTEENVVEILETIGHVPLPPYINREDEITDHERYQTVYAKHKGSVAAPTAGLHFDESLIQAFKNKGVDLAFLTLHVGAGTFQPVREEIITNHKMHAELIDVKQEVCDKVIAAKKRGGRVIAVGTTTVRSLETATSEGEIKPYFGDTNIFIYPGYAFQCVDAMVTNFHLPESSLLMLISAFAGHKNVMHAYQVAIQEKYRFYSYGDAMLIA